MPGQAAQVLPRPERRLSYSFLSCLRLSALSRMQDNRRKIEDERRREAEKQAAAKRASEAAYFRLRPHNTIATAAMPNAPPRIKRAQSILGERTKWGKRFILCPMHFV